jgi:DNA mismatch repair ATPase MutS
VILTGPNRGGKSTFCKSVGLAIITAQSWGFAWASAAELSPFAAIHTALETQGRLGHASTFEAEIAFAKTVLADSRSPAFVMMDEIFHSTNAVDGVEASRAFLTKLYSKQGSLSLISTHYRELANLFESQVSLLRMATDQMTDGSLVYKYRVESGVSDKSSVSEILTEHGLLDRPDASTRA